MHIQNPGKRGLTMPDSTKVLKIIQVLGLVSSIVEVQAQLLVHRSKVVLTSLWSESSHMTSAYHFIFSYTI